MVLDSSLRFIGDGKLAESVVVKSERGEVRLDRTDKSSADAAQVAVDEERVRQTELRSEIPLPVETLDCYVGHYSTALGPPVAIIREDQQLLAQMTGQKKMEIFAESEATFFSKTVPVQITFVTDVDQVSALIVHQNGYDLRMPRVAADEAEKIGAHVLQKANLQQQPRTEVPVDPAILMRYSGRYSMGRHLSMAVRADGGKLFIQLKDQREYEVHAEPERDFFWTVVAAQVSFNIDAQGLISGAVLHQSGRDLPFARDVLEPETSRAA